MGWPAVEQHQPGIGRNFVHFTGKAQQEKMMNTNGSNDGIGTDVEGAVDGYDDPNRGPLDRAANAVTGGTGDIAAATTGSSSDSYVSGQGGVISAIFDTDDEAREAVDELRAEGISDASLSLITQNRGTTTTSNVEGEVVDEEHTNLLRGILGGGVLGAGLGIAALAIPGVGPLVAAGAIASSAIPGAMAIGAAAGAALGTLNEVLKSHGVSDEDVDYYGDRMKTGGVLVTVHPNSGGAPSERIQEILYANGGHNASRARVA